mmetsp:Transcript_15874/g.34466  ORF Transcript_15874/g.34466 Transcript_15874/m.34466 type:complete len:238 (-) Transcript_15874:167-880(-)
MRLLSRARRMTLRAVAPERVTAPLIFSTLSPRQLSGAGPVACELPSCSRSALRWAVPLRDDHVQTAERLLNKLLVAIFHVADVDGDGVLTSHELRTFLAEHRLRHVLAQMTSHVRDKRFRAMSFAEFHSAVLSTRLVTLEVNELSGFSVHRSLTEYLSAAFFDCVDANKDGFICAHEMERLYVGLGIGDAEHARRAFSQFARANNVLSRKEFTKLLEGVGLMKVTLSAAQYHRCKGI